MNPNVILDLRMLLVGSNGWSYETIEPALKGGFPHTGSEFSEIVCFDISTSHNLETEFDKLLRFFNNSQIVRKNSTIMDIFDLEREEPLFDNGFDIIFFDLRQFIDDEFKVFLMKFLLLSDELFERSWRRGVPGRVFFILKLATSIDVNRRTLIECMPTFMATDSTPESPYGITFALQKTVEKILQQTSEQRGYSRGIKMKVTGMDFADSGDGDLLIQFGFDLYAPEN